MAKPHLGWSGAYTHTYNLVLLKSILLISPIPSPPLPRLSPPAVRIREDFMHLSESSQKHQYLPSLLPAAPSHRQSHPVILLTHSPALSFHSGHHRLERRAPLPSSFPGLLSLGFWATASDLSTAPWFFFPNKPGHISFGVCRNNSLA